MSSLGKNGPIFEALRTNLYEASFMLYFTPILLDSNKLSQEAVKHHRIKTRQRHIRRVPYVSFEKQPSIASNNILLAAKANISLCTTDYEYYFVIHFKARVYLAFMSSQAAITHSKSRLPLYFPRTGITATLQLIEAHEAPSLLLSTSFIDVYLELFDSKAQFRTASEACNDVSSGSDSKKPLSAKAHISLL